MVNSLIMPDSSQFEHEIGIGFTGGNSSPDGIEQNISGLKTEAEWPPASFLTAHALWGTETGEPVDTTIVFGGRDDKGGEEDGGVSESGPPSRRGNGGQNQPPASPPPRREGHPNGDNPHDSGWMPYSASLN